MAQYFNRTGELVRFCTPQRRLRDIFSLYSGDFPEFRRT